MSFAPLHDMDNRILELEFAEALAELQGLLLRRVRVYFNAHGTLSGCVIEGKLDRIESLPPDQEAAELVIGAQSVALDPADLRCYLIGEPVHGAGSVEFFLSTGVSIRVERVVTNDVNTPTPN